MRSFCSLVLLLMCVLAFSCESNDGKLNSDGDLDVNETDTESTEDVDITEEIDTEQDMEQEEEAIPFWQTPWTIPDRSWKRDCKTEHATKKNLGEKAEYYQWLVPKLHRVQGKSADGRDIVHGLFHHTCLDGPVPTEIVSDDKLPKVAKFTSYGNAGLWTAMYVASQAFRYATAKREGNEKELNDALSELRVTEEVLYKLLRISGTPGLLARGYWSPLPIFDPPEHDPENNVHKIDSGEFKGYTWVGDVSQEEYSGNMLAQGIISRLVDDSEVLGMSKDIVTQIGKHLMQNDLLIKDYDGKVTKFGNMNALSMTHFPGYNAWLTLTWLSMAARIGEDKELLDFYNDCMLQKSGEVSCIETDMEPKAYSEYLDTLDVMQGCGSNHDAVSQAFLAAMNLIWYEEDDALRKIFQKTLHDKLMTGDTQDRDVTKHKNPFFNMIYASLMDYEDPKATAPEDLIVDAICTLKEFPEHKAYRLSDTMNYPHFCESQRHGSLTEEIIPWREHAVYIFLFWRNPYERQHEDEKIRCGDLPGMEPPADYLLPYWMGRYYGWITPEM